MQFRQLHTHTSPITKTHNYIEHLSWAGQADTGNKPGMGIGHINGSVQDRQDKNRRGQMFRPTRPNRYAREEYNLLP